MTSDRDHDFDAGLAAAAILMRAWATAGEIGVRLARGAWRARRIIVAVGNFQNRRNRSTDVQGS
jgi:hypothetical protein